MRITLLLCLVVGCATTDYHGRVGGKSVQKEVCPTGCTSEVDRLLATGDASFERLDDGVYVTGAGSIQFESDPCTLLPAAGMCALACDPAALRDAIPAGTCVDFTCSLVDGREIVAGACSSKDL